MTWLHMEFVLIFITGPSCSKLGRTARQQLLTLALLLSAHGLGLILTLDQHWLWLHLRQLFCFFSKWLWLNKLIVSAQLRNLSPLHSFLSPDLLLNYVPHLTNELVLKMSKYLYHCEHQMDPNFSSNLLKIIVDLVE